MDGRKSFPLLSWAVYDFANTIFSAFVLTTYFPLYLTKLAGENWYLGIASTSAMILAGLATPFFGVLSDATGKTKTYLIRTTLICILFFAFLSVFRNPFTLIFIFIAACFFYHASLVFYHSLLVVVAPPERQGFVSGLGTGLGYLGVVTSLPLAHWIDTHFGISNVFAAGALLFLIFSFPLFLFVPERTAAHGTTRNLWPEEWRRVKAFFQALPERPKLLCFFAGNFFTVDALNSSIFWLSVFTREVFHPPQKTLILFLMGLNAAAFGMGILTGILSDRWGAMRTLLASSAALAVVLILLSILQSFALYVGVVIFGGAFAIAGIWTAGRKVLIDLAPKEKIGEYFGIYNLTTKVSVLGSLLFSLIADAVGFRPALGFLIFPATVGTLFLIWSNRLES